MGDYLAFAVKHEDAQRSRRETLPLPGGRAACGVSAPLEHS